MQNLLGLVLLGGVVAAVLLWTGRRSRRSSRRFKCHDCLHRRRTFADGVLCGYGNREVFKTPAHISMCPDWSPERGRR